MSTEKRKYKENKKSKRDAKKYEGEKKTKKVATLATESAAVGKWYEMTAQKKVLQMRMP